MRDTFVYYFPYLFLLNESDSYRVKCLAAMSETRVSDNVIMEYLLSSGASDCN